MKSDRVGTSRSNYDGRSQGWTARFQSMKFKMIVLGGIPLALAIVFIINSISTRYRIVNEMERMLVLSQLAGKMGALVHETQKERGATAVFMGSDGALFTSEMELQRIKTEPRRVELDEFVKTIDPASYGAEFRNALTQALNKMTLIDTHRENVDKQTIPDAQGISFYTEHNTLMLDVVLAMLKISTNGEIGRLATAYVNFLQGKERAGIERAIMSRAFAADRFEAGALRLVNSLIIAQETFFTMFEVLATPAEADLYNQKMSDPIVAEVQRMRDIAFKKGLATGRGKQFFDLMQNLGYGGAIHNFKNFLLRQDFKFKKQFEKNYAEALSIMKQINEFSDITEQEREAVKIIRETLEQYDSGTAAVTRMVNTGKTIAEMDATVKVDDGSALEALQMLGESLVIGNFGVDAGYWFDSITRKINLLKEVEDRVAGDLAQRALELKTEAQNISYAMSGIVAVVMLIVLIIMVLILRGITRPVDKIVEFAEGIAAGELNRVIDIRQHDEIGRLADAFRSMLDTINAVSEEINVLVQNIRNGELDSRGNAEAFTGDWRDLIMGVNGVLNAFMAPIHMTSTCIDQISQGDIPNTITEEYKGDFNEIKNNLNMLIESTKEMVNVAAQIAAGNLKVTVNIRSEKDALGNALSDMSANLRTQIQELREGLNVLAASASEISASSTQLAANAAETAASVGETTATIEEVRQTSQLANNKAQQVSTEARESAQIAQRGQKATEETVEGMNRIREQMASIADSIVKLSEQSQAIGGIIATVGDLADQSNLLAVNASIEATKAGEQGKGFTVVAQEIRSLAEQSKQATTQIQTILNNIQKATGAAVMATEQGTRAVEAGSKQASEAGDSIQLLANSIVAASQAMSQIAVSSQEQTIGMSQITEAMESIRLASTQNVDSSNQLEISAQNLQELGGRLKQLVDKYVV